MNYQNNDSLPAAHLFAQYQNMMQLSLEDQTQQQYLQVRLFPAFYKESFK